MFIIDELEEFLDNHSGWISTRENTDYIRAVGSFYTSRYRPIIRFVYNTGDVSKLLCNIALVTNNRSGFSFRVLYTSNTSNDMKLSAKHVINILELF